MGGKHRHLRIDEHVQIAVDLSLGAPGAHGMDRPHAIHLLRRTAMSAAGMRAWSERVRSPVRNTPTAEARMATVTSSAIMGSAMGNPATTKPSRR